MIKRGGFDLDGVIAQTGRTMFQHFQTQGLLQEVKYEDWRTYSLEEAFPNEINWDMVGVLLKQESFWASIEPDPIFLDAVENMAENSVEIHIVTARDEKSVGCNIGGITMEWLRNCGVIYDALALVPGRDKAKYCLEHKLDFFVEDKLSTAVAIADTWFTQSYLVATSYNEYPADRYTHIVRRSAPYFVNLHDKHYRNI